MSARTRHHMEAPMAVAIASQRNRDTSVFADTDSLIPQESVVVYKERTAL